MAHGTERGPVFERQAGTAPGFNRPEIFNLHLARRGLSLRISTEYFEADLHLRLKTDPNKLGTATRLRKETILSIKWIATRLHLEAWKSAKTRRQTKTNPNRADKPLMF